MSSLSVEIFRGEHIGLAWKFCVNPDSCGNHQHYENYLRLVALDDGKQGNGRTHILIQTNGTDKEILAFVTLRASSFVRNSAGNVSGEAALEIAELAVSKDHEHQGYGTSMVDLAVSIAKSLNDSAMGIRYITLCADDMAVPFYEKYGFKRMDAYGDIPREGWNDNCVPMYIRITEY